MELGEKRTLWKELSQTCSTDATSFVGKARITRAGGAIGGRGIERPRRGKKDEKDKGEPRKFRRTAISKLLPPVKRLRRQQRKRYVQRNWTDRLPRGRFIGSGGPCKKEKPLKKEET